TSVLAALAVPAVRHGIAESPASSVYVCNLRPQVPETGGFDVGRHLEALLAHGVRVDTVVCDTTAMALGAMSVPAVDVPLARPNGLAHDSGRLAGVLAGLAGC
ncbi:MAG: 2-phospho-L-lactate transferase CofD family protein, partial [Acidimicrobiales bacterium]